MDCGISWWSAQEGVAWSAGYSTPKAQSFSGQASAGVVSSATGNHPLTSVYSIPTIFVPLPPGHTWLIAHSSREYVAHFACACAQGVLPSVATARSVQKTGGSVVVVLVAVVVVLVAVVLVTVVVPCGVGVAGAAAAAPKAVSVAWGRGSGGGGGAGAG